MYQFDLVSVILGYMIGIILCYVMSDLVFTENDHEKE